MKILCVGDVVGDTGLAAFRAAMPELKAGTKADFTIVNGENASPDGVGLSRDAADVLLAHADVVTGGNHSFRRAGASLYSEGRPLLHPANFPYTDDESGMCIIDTGRLGTVRVISLMGVAFMEPVDSPFQRADALLAKGEARYTVVDFHAESTAEKKAMAFYLDGRVGAVFGTHTHVQTADEQVLPGGTGYISDVGMTGPEISVIGVEPQLAVKKQREHVPVKFAVAAGPAMLNAALFTLDDKTGLCETVERILLHGL